MRGCCCRSRMDSIAAVCNIRDARGPVDKSRKPSSGIVLLVVNAFVILRLCHRDRLVQARDEAATAKRQAAEALSTAAQEAKGSDAARAGQQSADAARAAAEEMREACKPGIHSRCAPRSENSFTSPEGSQRVARTQRQRQAARRKQGGPPESMKVSARLHVVGRSHSKSAPGCTSWHYTGTHGEGEARAVLRIHFL